MNRLSLPDGTTDSQRKHSSPRLRVLASTFATLFCTTIFACATDEHVVAYEDVPEGGTLPDQPQSKPDASANDASARCGDGFVQDGEECDDGNNVGSDGCSATCAFDTRAGASCPGTEIVLSSPNAEQRVGSVSGDSSNGLPSLQSPTCGGGNGRDVVYTFKSDLPGRARVRIDAEFDAILSSRTACVDETTELGCSAVPAGGGKTELVFPVAANQEAVVIVDGAGGASGKFTLDVDVATTFCGDGFAQYPEQCDDGNTASGDGCSNTCQLETITSDVGTCPGATYTFTGTTRKTVSFAGDTTLLASGLSTAGCSGASGKDQIYGFTTTAGGALKASLKASYAKSALHVRRECFTSDTQIDCRTQALASVPLETTIQVLPQQTYFFVVDGDSGAGGQYTFDVTFVPPVCGDGISSAPEQCDDGNTASGDGCAADCSLEPMPAAAETCPGAPITFQGAPGGPLTFHTTGSTTALAPNVRTTCVTSNLGTKDAVYSFVAPYNGYLTATAGGDFNLAIGIRKNCLLETDTVPPSDTNAVACVNANWGTVPETFQAPIDAGQTYYLAVKAGATVRKTDGVFGLDLSLTPSVCGNRVIEGGETCDDGGTENGDTCDSTCHIEPVPALGTACTTPEPLTLTETGAGMYSVSKISGNWNRSASGTFTAPCIATGKEAYYTITPPIDGVVVVDVSDASYNVSIGARTSCPHTGASFLACSNKSAGAGGERFAFPATANKTYWIMVDAAGVRDLGRYKLDVSLQGESCGDTLVSGVEQCDDGNLVDGDGCSHTCTLESNVGADECPATPIVLTGTGDGARTKTLTLSTANLSADYAGTCGGNSRDGVIAVTSDITGTMTAQLNAPWLTVFYARSTCGDATTELACAKANPATPAATTRELSFAVTAGIPTYLFVDGLTGAAGPATLSLTVTP